MDTSNALQAFKNRITELTLDDLDVMLAQYLPLANRQWCIPALLDRMVELDKQSENE